MKSIRELLHELVPFDPPTEVVLTTNLPENVCTVVVAFAANRESLLLPSRLDRKLSKERWRAIRKPGALEVALVLEEGRLDACVMNLTFRAAQSGVYSCFLQGGYRPRHRMFFGIFEDFLVRRRARKLRANIVAMMKYCLEAVGGTSGSELKASDRRPMKGSLRLRAGGRSMVAQLLNVSEGGLGVAISCSTSESQSLTQFFSTQKVLDAEMIDPKLGAAFKVTANNRQVVPGGLMVGLQAIDAKSIAPLVQRAFNRG